MNNILVNLKEEEGAITDEMKFGAKSKLKQMTDRKDIDVCKRHGIQADTLEAWVNQFSGEHDIEAYF